MRTIYCDHYMENSKLHPVSNYLHIGNTTIGVCLTCDEALKGQILGEYINKMLFTQTKPPLFKKGKSQ